MNILSTKQKIPAPTRPVGEAKPSNEESREAEGQSIVDKVVAGVAVAGTSMIPGVGGFAVLRPLAFEMGLNGDPAWKAMDTATLMNYASIPLLTAAVAFPRTGLIGAGICLAASGVAGLYGANAVGVFN